MGIKGLLPIVGIGGAAYYAYSQKQKKNPGETSEVEMDLEGIDPEDLVTDEYEGIDPDDLPPRED
jgi:hypothetical protein